MPVISDPATPIAATSRYTWDTETDTLVDARSSRLRPLQVTWEMTRACEWKAAPRRAPGRSPRQREQFSSAEAFHLIEEVAGMHVPLLALTGGDPLLRPDLFPVIEFAAGRSLRTSLTLLPTSQLDSAVIHELKACGLMRVAFWPNGSTPALNDSYWGIRGLR
jgi:AdoMet-dependent heme synthase